MRRGHLAAIARGEHHRQAIGGEDGEHRAWHVTDRGVGFGFVETGLAGHGYAVHLLQPARRGRQLQGGRQLAAVLGHRIGIVTASVAEIECIERWLRHPQPMPQPTTMLTSYGARGPLGRAP